MQYYASELKKDWKGFYACPKDFTLRNEQDFIRPVVEKIIPAVVRPDDNEGEQSVVTMVNAVPSVITASLVDNYYSYVTGTTGTYAISLPSANNATYGVYSILITIALMESLSVSYKSITTIAPATGTLIGSQTIRPGQIAKFRNNPSTNQWQREL